MRLDLLVAERYVLTRNKSQALIRNGLVRVDGEIVLRPAQEVDAETHLTLIEDPRLHWVSRSAQKLHGYLEARLVSSVLGPISVSGARCLDVGSSTGGFTQVLLDRWARQVDAVDVGTDQLHPLIRGDARVRSFEQMDIRDFPVTTPYDIIVCDASFISLTRLLLPILAHASATTEILLLYKPQFEVGPEHLRKTGVPKSLKVVEESLQIWEKYIHDHGGSIRDRALSSLVGEAGNQEWIYALKKLEK